MKTFREAQAYCAGENAVLAMPKTDQHQGIFHNCLIVIFGEFSGRADILLALRHENMYKVPSAVSNFN